VDSGIPKTRYAETVDGVDIAYQVIGDGPVTIVYINAYFSHLEVGWELPAYASFLRNLASFARVICFDKRGVGMSDRITRLPDLEARMDDIRAVMDASTTVRAAIYGMGEGAALAALFAASHPDRTTALIFAGTPRTRWAPDFPWGMGDEEAQDTRDYEIWGDEDYAEEFARMLFGDIPLVKDPDFGRWLTKVARYTGTPKSTLLIGEMWLETDVREVLPSIRVPTLVLAPAVCEPEWDLAAMARYAAQRIPGAKLVVCPGRGNPFLGGSEGLAGEVKRFLDSVEQEEAELDRTLATVLFTDIVGSTDKACEVGDARWKELLGQHDQVTRALLARYRGTEVKTTGDGFLATFDGPARAVRCAQGICEAVKPLGLDVRAGCHTGEIELLGTDVGGVAVHIGARVGALAGPSEVLVSSTVKDLVAGSGLTFADRGEHELKGVPGSWRLYAVEPAAV
jgi:class 3 adenylate cyclase/pimeloyl-ACP methyl ester carboxylesterase